MTQPRFYTTKVHASKTAAQIGEMLRKYGAKRYQVEWDDDGEPVALAFAMEIPVLGAEVPVRLTAQHEALYRRLRTKSGYRTVEADRAQALRIAWRQLHAWVEMCMEMVENGVKPFHEVFMADVLLEGGVRLVERFEEESGRLLPSSSSAQVIQLPAGR